MGRSVLLDLVRDSILEVYQARRLIDKEALLAKHPILQTPINCSVVVYIDGEAKNSYRSNTNEALIENIIISAKKALFEDPNHPPVSASKYLHVEIELTLHSEDGDMTQRDGAIIQDEKALVM